MESIKIHRQLSIRSFLARIIQFNYIEQYAAFDLNFHFTKFSVSGTGDKQQVNRQRELSQNFFQLLCNTETLDSKSPTRESLYPRATVT